MTEKFYDPLIAGSVPVYLGAPNVRDFAPADHCYIDVTDFAGPGELAAFLRDLAGDPQRYQRYLAWKRDGVPNPGFAALMARFRDGGACRLCRRSRAAKAGRLRALFHARSP